MAGAGLMRFAGAGEERRRLGRIARQRPRPSRGRGRGDSSRSSIRRRRPWRTAPPPSLDRGPRRGPRARPGPSRRSLRRRRPRRPSGRAGRRRPRWRRGPTPSRFIAPSIAQARATPPSQDCESKVPARPRSLGMSLPSEYRMARRMQLSAYLRSQARWKSVIALFTSFEPPCPPTCMVASSKQPLACPPSQAFL